MEQLTRDAGLSSFAFSFWKLYYTLPSMELTFPFLIFIKSKQTKPLSIVSVNYQSVPPTQGLFPFLLLHPIGNI